MGKYFMLIIGIHAIYNVINSFKLIIFRNGDSVIYSNSSNEDLDVNSNFYLLWSGVDIQTISCTLNCLVKIDNNNAYASLLLYLQPFELATDKSVKITFKFKTENRTEEFLLLFRNKFPGVQHTCPTGYFVISLVTQLPNCVLNWCESVDCVDYRVKTYNYRKLYFDVQRNHFINTLVPLRNITKYYIIVYLNVTFRSTGAFIGNLLTNLSMYFIDKSSYKCTYGSKEIILHNTLKDFDETCALKQSIPFIGDSIRFTVGSKPYYSWKVNIKLHWDSLIYNDPVEKNLRHYILIIQANHTISYVLRNDTFIEYIKYPSDKCKENIVKLSSKCWCCIGGLINDHYFYIKIDKISNQDIDSFDTRNVEFCFNDKWVPERVSEVKGALYLINILSNISEKFRKIENFTLNIMETVILKFELLPKIGSINLPITFIAICETINHTKITIFMDVLGKYQATNTSCYVELFVPVLNVTSILVNTSISYGSYAAYHSNVYPVGRIPSIVMITSRNPKFEEKVQCLTDGLDHLYTFNWSCIDANEPRDLIAVDYVTFDNAFLTFHETAPLIKFQCICSCVYITTFGREVFSISASIEISLEDNEMLNCEMYTNAYSNLSWDINVIYVLVTITIPLVFIIIAYFVTIGKFKETIQSEIISRLGFAKKEIHTEHEIIPHLIMDKSDLGERQFKSFLHGFQELEKNIDTLQKCRKPCFQRTFQKPPMIKAYDISLQKSPFITLKIDKRMAILKELEKRQHDKTFGISSLSTEVPFLKKKSSGFHDSARFSNTTSDSSTEDDVPRKYTIPLPEISTPWRKHSRSLPLMRSQQYDAIRSSVMMNQMKKILSRTSIVKHPQKDYAKLGVWKFGRIEDPYM